ncbi:MAG: SOS response-associated peptidase [Peptococcaceae bacterium]|jgi:putative SOS response-associated peptidase YedK|nr:SOS response-associated peptidase [Peptococcaceae bacterium]MDH7525423.1 SOS response-associated peptidase [Peptococcaceae bacterium]
MCGRFTTTIDREQIERYFKIARVDGEYAPLYNAAPAQNIPVVLEDGARRLAFYRWGLVPSWAKDPAVGNRLINARAETLLEKPSFRRSFLQRRCLVPADGFFEWKKEGANKTPYRIIMKDGSPFGMAGLWEVWSPPGQEPLYTCAIITTGANSLLRGIHERMPVILTPENYDLWLDPAVQSPVLLNRLLAPYPAELMDFYAVSPLVNSPLYNTPEAIKPV